MVYKDDGGPSSGEGLGAELVDEVLELIGQVIHDGPVQQLIAAKLITEAVQPTEDRSELAGRAIASMVSASQQSRLIMWALARPGVRPGMTHIDLPQVLERLDGVAVEVDVDDGCPHPVLEAVVRAIHRLCGGAALAGREVLAVRLDGDARGVDARIVVGGVGAALPAPWVELATQRLASVGGSVTVVEDDGATLLGLEVRLAPPDHPS